MPGKVLQVNFKYNMSKTDYDNAAAALSKAFAEVNGLKWKIWLMNEEKSEAGGIYYFEDEATLKAYLEGELAAQVGNHPALSEFSVKEFDIMPGPTETTRGPA